MSLASRLKRLEKRRSKQLSGPPCGVCDGMGTIDIVIDGEARPPDDPRPRPRGCPECGRVFTILLVEGDEGEVIAPAGRRLACRQPPHDNPVDRGATPQKACISAHLLAFCPPRTGPAPEGPPP